jgi:hypothetical protein
MVHVVVTVSRIGRRVWRELVRPRGGVRRRRWSSKDEGAALVATVIMIAVIGATAADFAFNARVELASAINARNDVRAHYLGRSAINLGRLLLRVQQRLIDPNRKFFGGFDLQLADYAPILIQAFNSKEGAEMLGGFLGLGEGEFKGLGVDVGMFDLEMESLDGRINLNCLGGANPGSPVVQRTSAALAAMMMPQRYNRLFEQPDENGDYHDRLAVLRAIVDWADQDQQMFGSTAPEDYRYDEGEDKYRNKDQYFDTVEELRLIRGIDEEWMAAFGDQLTVYGSCQVNIGLADVPTILALIAQYAASPSDPGLQPRNIALLARYVYQIGVMRGGFSDAKTFIEAVENPLAQIGMAAAMDSMAGLASGGESGGMEQLSGLPPVMGVKLNTKVSEAIAGTGPRRIWRMTATAEVGRVRKRVIAVWDQTLVSMQAGREGTGAGGFVYWREE